MIVVLDVKSTVLRIEAQGQGAVLQRHAIVAAEEWQQELTLHQRIGRMPLDVEKFAVRAQPAPFQQVQPPGIIAATDGHVVGDNVEDQPHVLLTQRADQTAQRRFAAQFRVDRGGVHHVIAVHGTCACAQQRRGVDMADAEAGEIGHQRHRVVQREAFMKLQTQGRAWLIHRSRSAA
ncbi:hypothetical protein D3C84_703910 [compost metagenome]